MAAWRSGPGTDIVIETHPHRDSTIRNSRNSLVRAEFVSSRTRSELSLGAADETQGQKLRAFYLDVEKSGGQAFSSRVFSILPIWTRWGTVNRTPGSP